MIFVSLFYYFILFIILFLKDSQPAPKVQTTIWLEQKKKRWREKDLVINVTKTKCPNKAKGLVWVDQWLNLARILKLFACNFHLFFITGSCYNIKSKVIPKHSNLARFFFFKMKKKTNKNFSQYYICMNKFWKFIFDLNK